jgi:hypothetical protein
VFCSLYQLLLFYFHSVVFMETTPTLSWVMQCLPFRCNSINTLLTYQ